jgi:hypothetical protein
MADYKRRREDEDTFGFGRYPKRSRRDCNGHYSRDYHSLSVPDNMKRYVNGSKTRLPPPINHTNLYHYSLSSELYRRESANSATYRVSNSSNVSMQRKRREFHDKIPPSDDYHWKSKMSKRDHHYYRNEVSCLFLFIY